MKITQYNNEQEWLDGRRGLITGTKAGSLLSVRDKKPLKGYYELIAERVAIPANGENAMDRGHRLEEEAIDRFMEETGKKVNKDLVIIHREDDERIAYSPDGYIGQTEDVEVKCLNSASHIEALLTKEIPKDYKFQVLQGFVVNDKLKKRHIVFYDPRMPRDYLCITVERKSVEQEVKELLELEQKVLKEIDDIENKLTF